MMKLIRFIPNMLTLTNAALGVLGMIFISKEQVTWAVYCAAIALVFDFLDGFLARLLNAQSELGKQLDSLADMITFGALPGFIVFQMIAVSRGIYFEEIYLWSFTDILVCSSGLLITAGATLRLGVFNLDTESRDYFIGIPTPAIAIFVISIPIILEIHYKLNFYNPISDTMIATLGEIRHWTALDRALVSMLFSTKFYVILSFILLFLMNMKVPMLALKFKGLSWAKNKWKYGVLIWVLISYLIFLIPNLSFIPFDIGLIDYLIIPIIMLGYFILSLFYATFAARKK
jgi:CDP-diacylglycerol---serine O-phosphatidyltransferase